MKLKSDYATDYQYGGIGKGLGGRAGPNAVRQITKLDDSVVDFSYDENGNMITGDGLAINYNKDNKPLQIIRNNITSTFKYGADGMRFKQTSINGNTTTTTYYVGKKFERQITTTNSTTDILDKSYIGGHTVLFTPVQGAFTQPSRIVHTLADRLGGVSLLMDGSRHLNDVQNASYLVQQHRGYDIFGRPRDLSATDFTASSLSNLMTDWKEIKRGFTGHEHLPESELIHMNGRIFDYNVGRFLGVDPVFQFPTNSQSANPYSYILNNPMAGTDPTGYSVENSLLPEIEAIIPDCAGSADKTCRATKKITAGGKNDDKKAKGGKTHLDVNEKEEDNQDSGILSKITEGKFGNEGKTIKFAQSDNAENYIQMTDEQQEQIQQEIFDDALVKGMRMASLYNKGDLETLKKEFPALSELSGSELYMQKEIYIREFNKIRLKSVAITTLKPVSDLSGGILKAGVDIVLTPQKTGIGILNSLVGALFSPPTPNPYKHVFFYKRESIEIKIGMR